MVDFLHRPKSKRVEMTGNQVQWSEHSGVGSSVVRQGNRMNAQRRGRSRIVVYPTRLPLIADLNAQLRAGADRREPAVDRRQALSASPMALPLRVLAPVLEYPEDTSTASSRSEASAPGWRVMPCS